MTSTPATLTVTLVDGTQVVVPDSLEQITPYVLQEQGDWFEDEIKFLRRLVQPGQTVIDIGANVGVYALSLARKVGPTGQVWAFEPASTTADLLDQSIAANGTTWLQLQRQALSNHTGTAWLQTPGQSELNSLAPDQQGPGEEVPLTTLDACLDAFSWQQVDLLKIDAEGEEERILAGGKRFFSELSPLVMFELKAGTSLHLELVERFLALGYGCHRLVPGLDALMPFDPADGVDGYLLNLFAAKPDRAAALAADGWLVPTANPEPPTPAELEPYHWHRVLMPLPYGRALAPSWEEAATNEPSAEAAEPLALWAYAQDSTQPIAQRLGALQRGYRLLSEQGRDKQRLTSLSSLARVAAGLGERTAALRALGHLIPGLETPQELQLELELKEPFLPPCSRFDDLDPQGRFTEWLVAAALESDEQLGHYSSFFINEIKARPRLERLQNLGFASPAILQRLALLNRRFPLRQPASPELHRHNPEQIACSQQAFDLIQAGEIESGKQLLAQAEEMGDNCSVALHLIAKALHELGKHDLALLQLQRAVELDPSNADALLELGIFLKVNGDKETGKDVIQQGLWIYALRLTSRNPNASELFNLGVAYQELGDQQHALELFDIALTNQPDLESTLHFRSKTLANDPARHDEALSILELITKRNSSNLAAICDRAKLLLDFGHSANAIQLLNCLVREHPDESRPQHQLAFALSIGDRLPLRDHLPLLSRYWYRLQEKLCSNPSKPNKLPKRQLGYKLRIGFLIPEVASEHVANLFLKPFLINHDQSSFEVELLVMRPWRADANHWAQRLTNAVIPLGHLTVEASRQFLGDRCYDIIVDTGGFTRDSGLELLASRCAPVQCHYIGFHASTGLNTIDWFIGDDLTAGDDLADQFVERLWRLPRLWISCCIPSSLPDTRSIRTGLPPVLGSFNQFAKVGHETLRFWAAALKRTPEAELHLKNFITDSPRPRQRIVEELSSLGIDPQRVVFLPRTERREEHLACYQGIDVALDTTPWAGATTTVDALLMGVPVVGILGSTTAGRMGCSILRELGRERWITSTPEAFAEATAELLLDLNELRTSRKQRRQAVLGSPLFDGADLTRHLQEAFTAMVAEAAASHACSGSSLQNADSAQCLA